MAYDLFPLANYNYISMMQLTPHLLDRERDVLADIIVNGEIPHLLPHPAIRVTDRQMDGRSIAYSALSKYAMLSRAKIQSYQAV